VDLRILEHYELLADLKIEAGGMLSDSRRTWKSGRNLLHRWKQAVEKEGRLYFSAVQNTGLKAIAPTLTDTGGCPA